jgi:adenylate cyclase class IV
MVRRARLHLDEVDDLGRFVEVEVVLDPEEPLESGVTEARGRLAALDIQEEQLVSHVDIDMLREGGGPPNR